MKIAVMTFVHAYNYGAELQSYALRKKLELLGYDAVLLDIYRPSDKEYHKTQEDASRFAGLYQFSNLPDVKSRIKIALSMVIEGIAKVLLWGRYKKRKRNFLLFQIENNRLSEHKYYNFTELYEKKEWEYSHFIVGSDQIWNYTSPFSLEPFFLTFISGVKKISYAASIGHSDIPDEVSAKYKIWLNDFDALSLREIQGVSLVSSITGRGDVFHVLDPVFLLSREEWLSNLNIGDRKLLNKPFVFVYLLSRSVFSLSIAKEVAKKIGGEVIVFSTQIINPYPFRSVKILFGRSPVDFISYLSKASFVVTNSFHGTSLAINFNVPFISTTRKSKRENSRFDSILGKLDLNNRLIYESDERPEVSDFLLLDYKIVNEKLEAFRKESLKYLDDAINS